MRVLVLLLALCAVADARPGGGQSYSSGGSHSSSYHSSGGSYHSSGGSYHSSGGGGSGDVGAGVFIALLIGGLLFLFVVIALFAGHSSADGWTNARSAPEPPPRLDLSPVLHDDADFSRAVFEDFAYQLYAAAQRARADAAGLVKLSPYLSPRAIGQLAQRGGRIEQVVVGSLRIVSASVEDQQTRVVVAIDANLTGKATTLVASERWAFVRAVGVKTRPPERTRSWPCPSCGAPWQAGGDANKCAHCGEDVQHGRFDWALAEIFVDAETAIGPTLTGTTQEIGNDFPTLEDSDAAINLMRLRQDDANVTWDAFISRVRMIYGRLNDAWNAQDLAPVRGLVTASQLAYLEYWVDEYKRQRLANKLDDAKIDHIALAKVTRDKFYDAITVRVYAEGVDYTIDRENRLVGGSRTERRDYTEYWTFLRSSARRGPVHATPTCPNCGAPLAISDAGACTHCNAEVESGSFDWLLSKIEQDDVYRG